MEPSEQALQQDVLALLARRDPASTICPSEVARQHPGDWRALMDPVRRAAAALVAADVVVATRSGEVVDPLAPGGPIRLGRGARFNEDGGPAGLRRHEHERTGDEG